MDMPRVLAWGIIKGGLVPIETVQVGVFPKHVCNIYSCFQFTCFGIPVHEDLDPAEHCFLPSPSNFTSALITEKSLKIWFANWSFAAVKPELLVSGLT